MTRLMQFSPSLVYGAVFGIELDPCEPITKSQEQKIRNHLHGDAWGDVANRLDGCDAIDLETRNRMLLAFRKSTRVVSVPKRLSTTNRCDICEKSPLNRDYFLVRNTRGKRKTVA